MASERHGVPGRSPRRVSAPPMNVEGDKFAPPERR